MMARACVAVTPPSIDACGEGAEFVVTFGDGSKAPMCTKCAVFMRQTATAHGTQLHVAPIEEKQ